ncbi:hypothetical protein AYI69_g8194 [Smittium culicis]|uniref:Uncharacterized protein n=1 Tax=Smittium culicis TaxID=133412 RepID=A0A1R1XLD2_9FUNG|nr:hypothetical protein AYI69_g8194 [Smittium culicis]
MFPKYVLSEDITTTETESSISDFRPQKRKAFVLGEQYLELDSIEDHRLSLQNQDVRTMKVNVSFPMNEVSEAEPDIVVYSRDY